MARVSGVVIGAVGCLGAVVITMVIGFAALFYFGFVQRGGVYDGLRAKLNQSTLDNLMPQVELYKIEHGAYPVSLDALAATASKTSPVMIYDANVYGNVGGRRELYYQQVGCDHYYLRSVGLDGIPFTRDDIVPDTDPASRTKIGLLIQRQPADETPCKAK